MIALNLEFHFWCLWFCGVPISDYLKLNAFEAYMQTRMRFVLPSKYQNIYQRICFYELTIADTKNHFRHIRFHDCVKRECKRWVIFVRKVYWMIGTDYYCTEPSKILISNGVPEGKYEILWHFDDDSDFEKNK